MGLCKKLSEDLEAVDVIIAGGGTAGCTIAGRLAEADPNLSILVIEGGQDCYGNPAVVTPALFVANNRPDAENIIFYQAKPSEAIANRAVVVPTGGVLGGGSAVNFMLYSRAQRDDFDAWQTPGWSADELDPFLKKLETYHCDGPKDEDHHGFQGPIQITDGTLRIKKVEEAVLSAAGQVGWPETPDITTLEHNNAFARAKRSITLDGRRSDAAHEYLYPRLRDGKHPNLHVLVESQVIRVLFDEDHRACGVEYRSNPRYQNDDPTPPHRTVRARKLVVVSSGACGSPLVLERSGIGAADVLHEAGVPLVVELPGVGRDYQDHHLVFTQYKTSLEPHETLDELLTGRLSFEDAMKRKDPRLGWNTIDVAGKCRPTEEEVLALGPEFKAAWDKDFRDKPNRPLMLMAVLNMAVAPPGMEEFATGQFLTMATYTAYPYSRGQVHITGPRVEDPLDFNAGFLTDDGDIDLKKQVWAYKKAREIMRRLPMYRGEVSVGHPPFPPDSKAACARHEYCHDISSLKDLEYTAEDDKIIEQFLRENINTTWHSLGTTKMAPREQFGVVDKDLNVYGVKGLKVADLSIAPGNVAANTNNTALLVGEKAADIIMRELVLN